MGVESAWYGDAIQKQAHAAIGDIVMDSALVAQRVAKENAEVDTGAMLADTHAVQLAALLWAVYNGRYYSPYREFGTRYDPGKPFMRPGMQAGAEHMGRRARSIFG